MKVNSIEAAWDKVNELFPFDYVKDEESSKRAGYPIYRPTATDHINNWISDLGCRLEINTEDGKLVIIFIETASQKKPATGNTHVTHFNSCKWDKGGLKPEEMQRFAKKIFENGKIEEVFHHSYGTNNPEQTRGDEWATVLSGNAAYRIKCEGFPITYVVHMNGYEVTEIIETIRY